MVFQIDKNYPLPLYFTKEDMTDDELFLFCAANPHLNIERDEDNQIIITPPSGGDTGRRHVKLVSAIDQWNSVLKKGEAFDSATGFVLPDGSMRSPDVSWVAIEKWNALSPQQRQRFLPFAPDFLVEVLSPTDHLEPAQQKMHKWIGNGARLAWLIAPKQAVSFVYRADGTVDKVEGFDKRLSGEDVLPGFEFELSVLI